MSTVDHLTALRRARRIDRIATHLRAQGCLVASWATSDVERVRIVEDYARRAGIIEHCGSLADARRMLKEWGLL